MPEWIIDVCWLVELRVTTELMHQCQIVFFQPFVQCEAIITEDTCFDTINQCKEENRLSYDDFTTDFGLADGHNPVRVVCIMLRVTIVIKSPINLIQIFKKPKFFIN